MTQNRIAVFIDAHSWYNVCHALNRHPDYKALKEYVESRGYVVRLGYFTCVPSADDHDPGRATADWLSYNGFLVHRKPGRLMRYPDGTERLRGNVEVDLSLDALSMIDQVDEVWLFGGAPDYRALADHVHRRGRRFVVAASMEGERSCVADELRRSADEFIEVADLPIFREPKAGDGSFAMAHSDRAIDHLPRSLIGARA